MLMKINEVKTYTFSEFREIQENREIKTRNEITLVNNLLDHIKKNKVVYSRLVLTTALLIHFNFNFVFANDFGASLDVAGQQILDLLMAFAKWGCIGFGVKDMIVTVLNGGNVKHAINNGLVYILAYVFISLYPQLFDLFSKIKF